MPISTDITYLYSSVNDSSSLSIRRLSIIARVRVFFYTFVEKWRSGGVMVKKFYRINNVKNIFNYIYPLKIYMAYKFDFVVSL